MVFLMPPRIALGDPRLQPFLVGSSEYGSFASESTARSAGILFLTAMLTTRLRDER